MIGGRDEQRIKINNLDPQALYIIHFVQNALKISAIKIIYIQSRGILPPFLYLTDRLPVHIKIFTVLYII